MNALAGGNSNLGFLDPGERGTSMSLFLDVGEPGSDDSLLLSLALATSTSFSNAWILFLRSLSCLAFSVLMW